MVRDAIKAPLPDNAPKPAALRAAKKEDAPAAETAPATEGAE
jgi:large subunit ribosomal protein L3